MRAAGWTLVLVCSACGGSPGGGSAADAALGAIGGSTDSQGTAIDMKGESDVKCTAALVIVGVLGCGDGDAATGDASAMTDARSGGAGGSSGTGGSGGSGAGGGAPAQDASADTHISVDVPAVLPPGPCRGTCAGTCTGTCVGKPCTETTPDGKCASRCEGWCDGMCSSVCTPMDRPCAVGAGMVVQHGQDCPSSGLRAICDQGTCKPLQPEGACPLGPGQAYMGRVFLVPGEPCPAGGTCRNGKCCRGCWNGTECLPGDTLAACGTGGVACERCTWRCAEIAGPVNNPCGGGAGRTTITALQPVCAGKCGHVSPTLPTCCGFLDTGASCSMETGCKQ